MSILFDTNVVSELRKGRRANKGVVDFALSIAEHEVYLSVITLHEIERGIVGAEQRQRPEATVLRSWFDGELRPAYAARTLAVTDEIAIAAASLSVARTIELADQLIAATALVNDLTLVTRNEKHLRHPGVRILNPFT